MVRLVLYGGEVKLYKSMVLTEIPGEVPKEEEFGAEGALA